jgi:hypothetical protein
VACLGSAVWLRRQGGTCTTNDECCSAAPLCTDGHCRKSICDKQRRDLH